MQYVSAEEKSRLDAKLRELRDQKIAVQERITAAASLGDLSENAEYQFAKDENRKIEGELHDLEQKLEHVAVVGDDDLPEDMIFLGHTVKLMDNDFEEEMLVRIVGEVEGTDAPDDVTLVSTSSPLGEALLKRRVGDTIKVNAPRGTLEYEILEIVQ